MRIMNRSNSFVSSLKWWPLQGHNSQSSATNISAATTTSGTGTSQSAPSSPTSNWPPVMQHKAGGIGATFGSSVAVQKLRESKWFKPDEQRIFCAVVECGFIVEVRSSAAAASAAEAAAAAAAAANDIDALDMDCPGLALALEPALLMPRNSSSSISFLESQDENETPVTSWFGIVLCKVAKGGYVRCRESLNEMATHHRINLIWVPGHQDIADNKPKPDTIEIFSVKIRDNGTYKLIKMCLADIWRHGWELRINNFADKEKMPHNEKDIRNQVSLARKAKQSLWNNNKHFVYWCRYGSRQQDVRKRQMSECVKWGSVGMNAGMLLVLNNRQKSYSHSK